MRNHGEQLLNLELEFNAFRFAWWSLVLICLISVLSYAHAVDSRQLEILAIGATMPQMTPVVSWFMSEPLTSVSHVPTRGYGMSLTTTEYERAIRLYLPRNYDNMLDCDLFVYVGGSVDFISSSQISMLKRAIEEGGKGAIADLGGVSVTDDIVSKWIGSGMWEVFPSDAPGVVSTGKWGAAWQPFTVEITAIGDNNPLKPFRSLGIERIHGNYGRLIIPREGSTIYGFMKGIRFPGIQRAPFLVAWDYSKGRTMLVSEFFGLQWFLTPPEGGENRYVVDIAVNMVLNTLGKQVHQDIPLLHLARIKAQEFQNRYGILLSTMEFAEKFGANTGRLLSDLSRIEDMAEKAEVEYLNQEVEQSISTWEKCIKEVKSADDKAMGLRDIALIWTYTIEWLVVVSTGMLCGVVIHAVMIKRMLYRETTTTRFN